MTTLTALPTFEDSVLTNLTPAELIDLILANEDRVPRNVIDACARRGEAMLDVLAPWELESLDIHSMLLNIRDDYIDSHPGRLSCKPGRASQAGGCVLHGFISPALSRHPRGRP